MTTAVSMMRGGVSAIQAQAINGRGINTALAAAGTTQITAASMTADFAIVTGASGTNGVILPAGMPGDLQTIFNSSASTLLVYPPLGAAIAVPGTGLGAVNAAFSHLTFKVVTYVCISGTQWLPNVTA